MQPSRSLGCLEPSRNDPCLHYNFSGGKILFVAIFLDDLMLFSNYKDMKDEIKVNLSMEDLKPAQSCLRIRITRTEDGIAIDQEAYIKSISTRFNIKESKPTSTKNTPNKWLRYLIKKR